MSTKILLVEDNLVTSDEIRDRLKQLGFTEITAAYSGKEAVSRAAEVQPDVVLMDIHLGRGIDGIEAARRMQAHGRVPVVYLTAYDNDGTLARAKITSPSAYLLKPVRERELQIAIDVALYKHQAEARTMFLAETALELTQCASTAEMNRCVAQNLYHLLEKTVIVTVSDFDRNDDSWAMSAVEGLHPVLQKLTRLIGFDVTTMTGCRHPREDELLTEGVLSRLPFDTESLTGGKIPHAVGERVKNLLSLQDIYCITVNHDATTYGTITILTTTSTPPLPTELIEAFIAQVAVFFQKRHAEQALKNSEEKFRSIFDMALDMICIADLDTAAFLEVNPAFTRILGYQEEELLHRPFFEFIHPADVAATTDVLEQELRKGSQVLRFINRYRCKDGAYRWLEWNSHPNPARGITYAIAHDITRRRETEIALQESEERLRLVLENTRDIIFMQDVEGRYLYLNGAAAYGLTPQDVVGKTPADFFERGVADAFMARLRRVIASGERLEEETQVHWQGKTLWFLDEISPVYGADGTVAAVSTISRDITRLKTVERDLREANATKDTFFSILAHDLRNPFMGIVAGTDMLKERCAGRCDAGSDVDIVAELHKSAQRVNALLEDLLTWARSQQGRIPYNPESINLSVAIRYGLKLVQDAAARKQVTLDAAQAPDIRARADSNMLAAILRNLLTNAVKFTPSGGRVTVSARPLDDGMVAVSVTDTGVGMAADKLARLFRVGEAKIASPGTDGEQGSGLGLIVCREFVERHGGRIWGESAEGRGSTVTFTLPACGDDRNGDDRNEE